LISNLLLMHLIVISLFIFICILFFAFYQYKINLLLYEKDVCFDDTFNHSAIGMAVSAIDGRVLRTNKSFCEILGYSDSELKNLKFSDITYEDDLETEGKNIKELLAGKKHSFQMEKRYLHKQGNSIWAILNISLIRNKKNKPLYFTAQVQDITRYKRLQNELTVSNEKYKTLINSYDNSITVLNEKELKYRSLVEQCLNGIMLADKEGYLIEFNREMERITGMKKDEVLNKPIWDVFVELLPFNLKTKESYNNIKKLYERKFILNSIEYNNECYCSTLQRKDGSTSSVENLFYPIITEGTRMICCICRDITELRKLENIKEKAEESDRLLKETIELDKLKTEFFANLSHEFRTPLNIILSSNKMIFDLINRNENFSKESAIKYLRASKQNSYRLLRLINNIIDITKIDAGFLESNFQCWNIVSVTEEISQSIVEYAKNKGITITFDTNVEEKYIVCDADKIERIMLNLLSNAIKFTEYGGKIDIKLFDKNEYVEIVVADSGIGISEDKLPLIFERFRQVDKSLTRKQEGSGIGLSLVKYLVEIHKGTIEVCSTVGEGTTFKINLPLDTKEVCDEVAVTKELCNSKVEKVNIEFSDIYF
jgi:PAS domain S-box